MSTNSDLLELEILQYFKQSLIKYIHLVQHQGFQQRFVHNPAYQPEKVFQIIDLLIEKGDLYQSGELICLSPQGSNRSCEGLKKET